MEFQLATSKLSSREVAGDENCLFCALIACLYNNEDKHYKLWQNIVQYIYTLATFEDSLPGISLDVMEAWGIISSSVQYQSFFKDSALVGQQLNILKKNWCWAGEDIISVVASYWQHVIKVYSFTTKRSSSLLVYASTLYDHFLTNPISIAFYLPSHYKVAVDITGKTDKNYKAPVGQILTQWTHLDGHYYTLTPVLLEINWTIL